LIAAGVILLLSNLGIVPDIAWTQLIRFWPVLLIALGIDVLVGRPSLGSVLAALIGTCALIALALAAIYLFGPETWVTRSQSLGHPLGSAVTADVALSCSGCSIDISGEASPEQLIEGTVTVRADEQLLQVTHRSGDSIHFELTGKPSLPISRISRTKRPWTVRLHSGIPIELAVTTGGPIAIDLRGLRIESVDVSAGREPCEIILPTEGQTTVDVSADDLIVRVPDGAGVRIVGTPEGGFDMPEDYVRAEGEVRSPGYETAATIADVHLRPGVEDVEIVPLKAGPLGEVDAT
jgi:hypothetical protein